MHRLEARLIHLPHKVLARFAANAIRSNWHVALKTADELLAQYAPLDVKLVDRVLLDPDLLSKIMASLDLCHVSSALTCKQWSVTWREEISRRRVLRPLSLPALAFDLKEADHDGPEEQFAGSLSNVTALDDERLGVHVGRPGS